ncbi:MAG: hypothetical protein Q7T20_12320 [Saprospiraceae bacterium]|nr:hypothetical protein [Saprospiraceae bacterium]
MKKHSGMRPHDVLILLKIAAKGAQSWYMKDLAIELGISASEVSESINRSVFAGLLAQDKTRLMQAALLEFLEHGLRYVYPQQPGALVRGLPTAHTAQPLSDLIHSDEAYVWPYGEGKVRGQAIEPLHPNAPEACLKDPDFYALVALCDALRVGRTREKQLAVQELKKRIC